MLLTLGACAMLLCAPGSQASLIGDTVDAAIFAPNGDRVTGFGLDAPFVVAADDSDLQTYSNLFNLDVHGEGFTIEYIVESRPGTGRTWVDGVEFRLFDLDWVDHPSGRITDIVVVHNLLGWDASLASFGDDFVNLDWGGSALSKGRFVEVSLITEHAAVPLPAAAWLFGSALIGLVAYSRRRRAG